MAAASRWLKKQALEWNLFESESTQTNRVHLRTALIATRFYIVTLTIAIVMLIMFTAFGTQLRTVTTRNPTQVIFKDLYSRFTNQLQCPCSRIDISYNTFIKIDYRLHPVCSSVFTSETWINLLFSPLIGYFYPTDFRSSASGQFQLLASLCSSVNRTINDAINEHLSETLLSPQTLSPLSLNTQAEVQNLFWQISMKNSFRRLLELVRKTTLSNSLQPALQTNKIHSLHVYPNGTIEAYPLETVWQIDSQEECICQLSASCSAPSGFYDQFSYDTEGYFRSFGQTLGNVPGFLVGCYPLDSLLQSNLECFFNQSCLQTVLSFFPTRNNTNFNALQMDETHYSPSTTLEEVVNELFIEYWSSNDSFGDYYSQCAPLSCTHKVNERNRPLYILTTLLGLYGGLTVALRFGAFFIVNQWRKRQIEASPRTALIVRFRAAWRSIRILLAEVNFFQTPASRTDAFSLETSKIVTRVYILSLSLSVAIITIFILSSSRTQSITLRSPSQQVFQHFYNKYQNTIRCPCQHIVIPYKSFVSLSVQFHPVCTSVFVNDAWVLAVSKMDSEYSIFSLLDLRVSGATFFNTLAALCSLSKATVNDNWYIFGQNSLITDVVLSELEFQNRIDAIVEQFEKNTIAEFKRTIALIETHTRSLYATGFANVFLHSDQTSNTTEPFEFNWRPYYYDECSCGLDDQCRNLIGFYNYPSETIFEPYFLKFTLPNLFVGCHVIPSVLISTLECFFNETCVNAIQDETNTNKSSMISILQINATKFAPNTPIETFVNHLMIETWIKDIEYNLYYEQCAPEQCTYTFEAGDNVLKAVTTILGLFGGLLVGLRIIVCFLVTWIRVRWHARLQPNGRANHLSIRERVHNVGYHLKSKLLAINMFETELSWRNLRRQQQEILATRMYLLFISFSIAILVFYTSLTTQLQVVTKERPSIATLEQLRINSKYSDTLECPCQNIVIPYESFLSITPRYHQICSSDFVLASSDWLNLLYSPVAGMEYHYDDFRLFVVPQFRLLLALCTLTNETVIKSVELLNSDVIITEKVQYQEVITSKVNTIFDQFRLSVPRTFTRALDLIRGIAQGNGIVSSILSNWRFVTINTTFDPPRDFPSLWPEPRSYGDNNCSCGTSSMCSSQATFDGLEIPGFRVGCYPLESLLQSTLECLYNVSCIELLRLMYYQSNRTFSALDSSLSSPNATLQSIMENMFVDEWETEISYEKYYMACVPLFCTYSYTERLNPAYIVTTTIALYGGLNVMFKIFAPILVRLVYRYIHRFQRRVNPTTMLG